ncbi:MAG: CaiB/BaiF CoA transferase family protein [Hyphomicrobiaceae bacterium]
MAGPLDGIRVIECSTVALGPWAAQTLGDLGADVIKIESETGDTTRYLGPARHEKMASFYLGCNRNKRSIVLDLKSDDGREALYALARTADVVLHNFRKAPAKRLGLTYAQLSNVNPSIICAAAYGYRAEGPMGARAAYDDIIQAGTGMAALQSVIDGEPRFVPSVVADKTTSQAFTIAILAALVERERSGSGQDIEVPMFETLVANVMVEHLFGETFLPSLGTAGYKRILNSERRPYRTKDGFFALLPYTDAHWQEFSAKVGRPELGEDERFLTLQSRLKYVEEYYALLGEIAATRTNAEWSSLLADSNIPHGPVNTLEELFENEQLNATNFWMEVEHPTEGRLRMTDIPQRFSRTPAEIRRLQPRLGENSAEVLKEAGYSDEDIARLVDAGVTNQWAQ